MDQSFSPEIKYKKKRKVQKKVSIQPEADNNVQNNPATFRSPISQMKKMNSPNQQKMHSPNSNSFSMIYDQFYPRTPIKTIKASKDKQFNKDQLAQLLDKGILRMALVQQITFNSNTSFEWQKYIIQLKKRMKNNNELDIQFIQTSSKLFMDKDQNQFLDKMDTLKKSFCQCFIYEARIKQTNLESSMLFQRSFENNEILKLKYVVTMIDAYKNYKKTDNINDYFIISTSNYLILYAYIQIEEQTEMQDEQDDKQTTQSIQNTPYCLFIARNAANTNLYTNFGSITVPPFLTLHQIQSTLVTTSPLLGDLISKAMLSQFPTKYSVNLIKGKHMNHLFNVIVNINIEKDSVDIVTSYPFLNGQTHVQQVYNGIDYLVPQNELIVVNDSFFKRQTTQEQEYKIQFDGFLSIRQILNIKDALKDIGYDDIVVSDTKLNPITTLLTQTNIDKVKELLITNQ